MFIKNFVRKLRATYSAGVLFGWTVNRSQYDVYRKYTSNVVENTEYIAQG
jgi:hypothetical protein